MRKGGSVDTFLDTGSFASTPVQMLPETWLQEKRCPYGCAPW